MIRETALPVVMAGLLVLAGCAGVSTPTLSGDQTPGDGSVEQMGTINFYVSDERNAIGDFEHLNVTISKVGFHEKGADDEDDDSDENETSTNTTTTTVTTDANTTTTTVTTDANTTTTSTSTNTTTPTQNATTTEAEEAEEEDEEDEEEREGWVTRDVNNTTIDLTEYQGANATLLSQFDVPNGTYNKVFIYVSSINATLENGEQVNVKLPSERLHLNTEFTVGDGEEIDFVFDITVFKAGNSGKYILKPVVSESGTDVPIEAENEGEQGPPEDAGPPDEENESDDEEDDVETSLDLNVEGPVEAGEDVTLSVTKDGEAVANAQVFINGERVGMTDSDGTLTVSVPASAESLEVTIRDQGSEVETELMVESSSEAETTTTT